MYGYIWIKVEAAKRVFLHLDSKIITNFPLSFQIRPILEYHFEFFEHQVVSHSVSPRVIFNEVVLM